MNVMNIPGMGTGAAASTATASRQNSEIADFQRLLDQAVAVSGSSELSAEPGKGGDSIDRSSKLYEKSQELETFFMKIVLSSMRATVNKTNLSGEENSYASKMYEDMMYDEFAAAMTKNAGFGLADQVYIQLSGAGE